MSIRNANFGDFETVRSLLLKEGITTNDFFTRDRYTSAIDKWGKYYLVEEREGKVVGFISGFDDGGIFYGYMGRLVVDENYRRQGVGERLARACLQQFKESGIPIIFAGAGFDNKASQDLLRKIGFVDEGYKLMHFNTGLI